MIALSWLGAFFVLLIYTFVSSCLIGGVVKYCKKETKDIRADLTFWLGTLEILVFTMAYILNHAGFIAVWLGVKIAGRWKADSTSTSVINLFLIGNLLVVTLKYYQKIGKQQAILI